MVPGKKRKRRMQINHGDPKPDELVEGNNNDEDRGREIPSALDRALGKADEALKDILKQKVEELELKGEELEKELTIERAKVQNIRRRADEEKAEALKYANYDLAFDLLNVLDCFEMGANCDVDVAPEVLKPYIQGVEYTIEEMNRVLAKHGITEIPTDIPFDPEQHKVFECVEDEEKNDGTILHVKRKGYKLHDRVLRNALVTIAGTLNGCSTVGEG